MTISEEDRAGLDAFIATLPKDDIVQEAKSPDRKKVLEK
jgi:hypothetical protein